MKVEWGQGRVEVIAARDEILAAFADGRSIKSIYVELKAAKRVSLSYDGFYRRVRKLRDSAKKRPSTPRGQSRMEVIKLRSQIRAAIAGGRTLKAIYDEMKAEGRVSATYKSFWENVRKFCGSPRSGQQPASQAKTSAAVSRPLLPCVGTGTTAEDDKVHRRLISSEIPVRHVYGCRWPSTAFPRQRASNALCALKRLPGSFWRPYVIRRQILTPQNPKAPMGYHAYRCRTPHAEQQFAWLRPQDIGGRIDHLES